MGLPGVGVTKRYRLRYPGGGTPPTTLSTKDIAAGSSVTTVEPFRYKEIYSVFD